VNRAEPTPQSGPGRAGSARSGAATPTLVIVNGWSRRRASYEAVDYIIGQLFSGELKPGDRIDIEKVAVELNISRSPVREAVLELQRDGFVINPFHRSASIAPFDAAGIEDSFDLYGLLWARATAAAARLDRDDPLITELGPLVDGLQGLRWPEEIHAAAYHYRRAISRRCASQRLRALLRSFRSFVPTSYRMGFPELSDSLQIGIANEFKEISRGNPERAARATQRFYREQAGLVVADLRQKNIIE
jgi:DNA-binding GntR family transcriptional regulator